MFRKTISVDAREGKAEDDDHDERRKAFKRYRDHQVTCYLWV